MILLILAAAVLAMSGGCTELTTTVDEVLGKAGSAFTSNAMAASPSGRRESNPAGKALKSRPKAKRAAEPSTSGRPAGSTSSALSMTGKKRAPGKLSPTTRVTKEKHAKKGIFTVKRDPFRQPTEVLPSDCPPSVPLCRFDRSQLKLVGVIQIGAGQFKGMVEDPDGRGYFVSVGMQIGNATVTQVSNKGVMLRVHKTSEDVLIPLYKEPKESEEF
jgi:hypothetical protein